MKEYLLIVTVYKNMYINLYILYKCIFYAYTIYNKINLQKTQLQNYE